MAKSKFIAFYGGGVHTSDQKQWLPDSTLERDAVENKRHMLFELMDTWD